MTDVDNPLEEIWEPTETEIGASVSPEFEVASPGAIPEPSEEEIWEPTETEIGASVSPESEAASPRTIPEPSEEEIWEPTEIVISPPLSINNYRRIGFFEDDNNKISPIRISSFSALIVAILFGLLTFFTKPNTAEVEIAYGLLATAFGGKVVKKYYDRKI